MFPLQERKSVGAHNWFKVYSVHQLPGGEKILVRSADHGSENGPSAAAPKEDLFNILRESHLATGHGKELAMYKHVSRRYCNITREMCNMFSLECTTCIKMKNYVKKPRAGHKPILTVGFGSRGQVDLIDMQSSEFGGMKWLLTYCDHGTKFAATCPVPNKQVEISSRMAAFFKHDVRV